jgi:hypothetical protein
MLTIALSDGEKYVAGAYVVFLVLILIYLAIMATKLGRLEREVVELTEIAEREPAPDAERAREPVA